MTENKSLELTLDINKTLSKNLLPVFERYFPFGMSENFAANTRDRVFNSENTLLTMLLSSCYDDKTLKNSVLIYKTIHEKNQALIDKKSKELEEQLKQNLPKKPGRPRKSLGRIPISKTKSISSDTSGYSQARQRLSYDYLQEVYNKSIDYPLETNNNTWHNREVFVTDGTYVQLQDTEEIRKEFKSENKQGYPRGLLQCVISQSYGTVYDHKLSPDKKSELEVFSQMIDRLPSGSVLLADDLYNCYAIFALLRARNIDIIVPGKRKRQYEVLETIASGDEIVRIINNKKSPWLSENDIETVENTPSIKLRRIEYRDPNKERSYVLYSTILDKRIEKSEIILKYLSRWDIEISIREIKTIMDINVVRSKTVLMSRKEILAALTAYNYIRRLITESTQESAFSPEGDIIYQYYTFDKALHIDKLGRVYNRWSPGRYGNTKK